MATASTGLFASMHNAHARELASIKFLCTTDLNAIVAHVADADVGQERISILAMGIRNRNLSCACLRI